MERFDRYLIALVLAHFIVTLVHATAHFALEIVPAGIDLVFIIGVILIGPLVALVILRFNPPLAAGLLAVLMGASLVYGMVSHFLVAGPDNVAFVGSQSWTCSSWGPPSCSASSRSAAFSSPSSHSGRPLELLRNLLRELGDAA